ncbi:hypothetical protein bmyco0002_60120 [Bacillus pseudomycoides]|nr:hypothetical protein bmyco0002_60120 [Bacillus pseudomycoides]
MQLVSDGIFFNIEDFKRLKSILYIFKQNKKGKSLFLT